MNYKEAWETVLKTVQEQAQAFLDGRATAEYGLGLIYGITMGANAQLPTKSMPEIPDKWPPGTIHCGHRFTIEDKEFICELAKGHEGMHKDGNQPNMIHATKGQPTCSLCGVKGHNKRTCKANLPTSKKRTDDTAAATSSETEQKGGSDYTPTEWTKVFDYLRGMKMLKIPIQALAVQTGVDSKIVKQIVDDLIAKDEVEEVPGGFKCRRR